MTTTEPTHYCTPCDKAVTPIVLHGVGRQCPDCRSGRVRPIAKPRLEG